MCDESSWKGCISPGILVTYKVNTPSYRKFSIALRVSALRQVKRWSCNMCNECFLLLVLHFKKKLDCSVWWSLEHHWAHCAWAANWTWGSAVSKNLGPLAPSLLLHLLYCAVSEQMQKTAFVQHMFSSYSKLFLQLEGLRHYYPSKPYTNKEGLPQKRASAEECKVYLCSLTQDLNFIKFYKISIDSVSPYHWILIATWPKVNYTFKMNREKDIMQSTGKSEPLLSYFCCTPEHTGFSV